MNRPERRGGILSDRRALRTGVFTAAILAFSAGVASADEVSGEVTKIDTVAKMLTGGDKNLQWSPENSQGVKLDEFKEGDKVKVMYEQNQDGHNDVLEIMKEQ